MNDTPLRTHVDLNAAPRCEVRSVVVTRENRRTIVHVTFHEKARFELEFTDALADALAGQLAQVRQQRDDDLVSRVGGAS
jgi:hypothetical protein